MLIIKQYMLVLFFGVFMNKNSNNFSSVIISFVVIVLLITLIGSLFIKTNNLQTAPKNFYVVCGTDKIYQNREDFEFVKGKTYTFEIKSDLDFINNDIDYTVLIVPNPDYEDFSFTINNGESQVNFKDMSSLAKGFVITQDNNLFSITANYNLEEILSFYYKGVNDCPVADLPYFRLVFTSVQSNDFIYINFLISE